MALNEDLVERLRRALAGRRGIRESRMFGGIAFLLNGNMCCGITKDDEVVLRIGAEAYEKGLKEPHVSECRFTGRPMKGMVTLAPEGVRSAARLRRWVDRAARYAASLPQKSKKTRK